MSDIDAILKKQQELARLQKELEAQKAKAGAAIREEQGKVLEQIHAQAARLEALNADLKKLDLPPNDAFAPLLEALKQMPSARSKAAPKSAPKEKEAEKPASGPVPEKPPARPPKAKKAAPEPALKAESAASGAEAAVREEEAVILPLEMPDEKNMEPEVPEGSHNHKSRETEGGAEAELPAGCRMSLIGRARLQVNYRGGAVVVSNPSVEPGSDLGDFLKEQGMSAPDRVRVGAKAVDMLAKNKNK
ncbi:MAG: hypothetical protein IT210_17735 [Armatimonadetes bacterium]|nr:hypothetical protein [Armatimonadota bacterium]